MVKPRGTGQGVGLVDFRVLGVAGAGEERAHRVAEGETVRPGAARHDLARHLEPRNLSPARRAAADTARDAA